MAAWSGLALSRCPAVPLSHGLQRDPPLVWGEEVLEPKVQPGNWELRRTWVKLTCFRQRQLVLEACEVSLFSPLATIRLKAAEEGRGACA